MKHLSTNNSLALFPDFTQRIRVLQYLGYLDSKEGKTVTLKGRVACEMRYSFLKRKKNLIVLILKFVCIYNLALVEN
jgi:hypothetical protein